MNPSNSTDILEALLFSTDRPLPASRLATVLPVKEADVEQLVRELNAAYEATGRVFRIRCVAGGYRLFTEPEFESYVDALAVITREARLSQAALETLAVVAYRQPVSKNDIEFVRGCDCDGVLRTLLSRRLVAIKGRSDAPGRPLLYATADRFLEYFGLASLADLPDWDEIATLVGDDAARGRLTLVRPAEADGEPSAADAPAVGEPAVSGDSDAADTGVGEPAVSGDGDAADARVGEPAAMAEVAVEMVAVSPGEDAS